MKNIKQVESKEEAREIAISWQYGFAEKSYSYGELLKFQKYFYKLAKKFNLVREFHENGII